MEATNKKKIIKSYSYNGNFSKTQSDFAFIKEEDGETKHNKSILKRSKKDSDRKVLFNLNKLKINDCHIKPFHISSNANESLLKTNVTKNQTNFLETLKINFENKNLTSINNINNNYVISTGNKILYRNKSQENIHNTQRPNYNYNNSFQKINDNNQEGNNFKPDLIENITNIIEPNETDNIVQNFDNKPPIKIRSNKTYLEILENLIKSINTNFQYQNTNKISTTDGYTLPILKSTKRKPDKMLAFLKKSKKDKVSAKDIMIYYLKENERDKSKNIPINNFKNYLKNNNYRKFNYGLNKIYGNSETFLRRMEEIKKNNIIASKKDFNIESYQETLLKMLKKRINENSYIKLQNSYKLFNEINLGAFIPKGRYINLAEKLRDFLSKDVYEKLKKTDKHYLLFLRKKKEEMKKKKIENQTKYSLYQKMSKTLRVYRQKIKRNKSY